MRIWTHQGVTRQQLCYGSSSFPAALSDAARLAALKRGHWQVEHGLHLVKAITLGEDASQTHVGHSADVLAILTTPHNSQYLHDALAPPGITVEENAAALAAG